MAEEIVGIKVTTDTAQATQDVQKLDKAFEKTDEEKKVIIDERKDQNQKNRQEKLKNLDTYLINLDKQRELNMVFLRIYIQRQIQAISGCLFKRYCCSFCPTKAKIY